MTRPILDRRIHFDARSRSFPAEQHEPRSYTWRLGQDTLNQGDQGHCVGFSIAHEAAARPAVRPQDKQAAHAAFYVAQRIDRTVHGLTFPDGATCLAGMKAGVELGWWAGYVWSFGVDHLARSIGYHGPAVLGTWWKRSMFRPTAEGRVTVDGPNEGGHAYLAVAFDKRTGDFLCANSWGTGWSPSTRWRDRTWPGHFVVSYEQMDRLLREDGEAATPTGRKLR